MNKTIYRVWAKTNMIVDGRTYPARARIANRNGNCKHFKSYSGAVAWCRERFPDNWESMFEIALY